MTLRSLIAAAVLAFLPTLSAGADSRYVSGLLGYTIAPEEDAGLLSNLELHNFLFLAAAVGTERPLRAYGHFRLEGELSYRQNSFDDGEFMNETVDVDGTVLALGLLVNAVVDFETGSRVRPYVLLGGGGTWTSLQDVEVHGVTVADDDRLQYAYQLGAGVGIDLTPAVVLDLGYRYFSTSKDHFEDELEDDFYFRYRTHSLSAGLRVRF